MSPAELRSRLVELEVVPELPMVPRSFVWPGDRQAGRGGGHRGAQGAAEGGGMTEKFNERASQAVVLGLEALAAQINAEHRACEASLSRGLEHALNAGRLLLEAKTRLKHGGWLKWVREQCTMPPRLVQKYMQLARAWPGLQEANAPRVAHLSFREALKLVGTVTQDLAALPPAQQERAVSLADRGEERSIWSAMTRVQAEARKKQDEAHPATLTAASPEAWHVRPPFAALQAEIASRPEFVARRRVLEELDREIVQLERRLSALRGRRRKGQARLTTDLWASFRHQFGPTMSGIFVEQAHPGEALTPLTEEEFKTYIVPFWDEGVALRADVRDMDLLDTGNWVLAPSRPDERHQLWAVQFSPGLRQVVWRGFWFPSQYRVPIACNDDHTRRVTAGRPGWVGIGFEA